MKSVNVNPRIYIDFNKENVISDPNREEIIGPFYEKELEKTNEKEFRIVISYMLNGYISSLNSWIDKKDNVNK